MLFRSTQSAAFSYQVGNSDPALQSFQATNINACTGGSCPISTPFQTSTNAAWLTATPASGTIKGSPSVVPIYVQVHPASLSAGSYSGVATVTSPDGNLSVGVTLTVTAASSISVSPNSLSFSARTGDSSTQTQTVAVSGGNSPAAFTASASGGSWLSVSPTSGSTPANLVVLVNPTGLATGVYSGNIAVASPGTSSSTQSIPVTFNVGAAFVSLPVVTAVVNAASYQSGGVAPGELVTIGGSGIGPGTGSFLTLDTNGNVSTQLGGVQVLFNGIPAPLTYVSSTQINAVAPYEIQGLSSPTLQVQYLGQTSRAFPVTPAASVPALFTSNGSGTGPVAALNQDQSYNEIGRASCRERV